ncbi:PAP2 family protein [Aspergillus niger]|nr:PAP2 family protein [Aspergillus niger]
MSGPGEERWRGGRSYDQNRHSAQRQSNARTMSAHGGSRGGQHNWGDSRDQFASGPQQEQHVPVRGFNAAESKGALRKGAFRPTSVRGMTPANTQLALGSRTGRCAYRYCSPETNVYDCLLLTPISSPEPRPYHYKPQGKDVNNRASGPWGAKPNQMANGKDFFLELRKQVTALQQGGTVAGG